MCEHIAKVVIVKYGSQEAVLYDLDKRMTLDDIMIDLLKTIGVPNSRVYTLKLEERKNYTGKQFYIKDVSSIENADRLKIVYTIDYQMDVIFQYMETDARDKVFDDLRELSVVDEFVAELARTNNHLKLMKYFETHQMRNNEILACCLNFAHLLKIDGIRGTTPNILTKTLQIVKNDKSVLVEDDEFAGDAVSSALMVLRNILVSRCEFFYDWQQTIIRELPFTQLMYYLYEPKYELVGASALSLINMILRRCKGEKRTSLIRELNQKKNKEIILKYVIGKGKLDASIEHELYVCQTFLLSLYADAMNTFQNCKDFQEESEKGELDDMHRRSIISVCSDEEIPMENLDKSKSRFSMASILSESSRNSYGSSINCTLDVEEGNISILTAECISYFRKRHAKLYHQSQIEEKTYKPGIISSSERVVKMLCRLLHIGKTPDKTSTTYQPLVFSCNMKEPFLLELFSRTMWLLSKTRTEMKGFNESDYEKVLRVVYEQVKIILEKKLDSFAQLTNEMGRINYETVAKIWEERRQKEEEYLLKEHPCVNVLRRRFAKENKKEILRQRLNFMRTPVKMKRAVESDERKKPYLIPVNVFLSENEQVIYIRGEQIGKKSKGDDITCDVQSITNLAHGKNCPHASEVPTDPFRAFSIIVEKTQRISLLAGNEKDACYWIDGLSLLKNIEEIKSNYYQNDLDTLVEMDLKLSLMDLQNVMVPKKAPKVPLPPDLLPVMG
ncbi:engulfment and cell motility protein 2 [Aethina tumida]|uniref:engulfment and cell motility protein 2 n=1 Tax=Aethina tumida TaxID=116153 RepID=UPI0021498222|nr:engulfment and cell motility protein 2 [Aethina tumida]